MKKIFCFIVLLYSSNIFAVEPPANSTVKEPCILTAEFSNPKVKDDFPIQLCMYTHTEIRGIFAATACVAVLIETQSGNRHPFYGSKGHWGIEGTCDGKRIADKFHDPQTLKTVNPISDLKTKRKNGFTVKIINDDFKIGPDLLEVTKP